MSRENREQVMNGKSAVSLKTGETLDSFFHGRVRVIQRRKGYRFSLDAPLLADFVRCRSRDFICELGTGNGIVAILLSIKPFQHLTAVEIQPGLADLAHRNVALNGLEDRISIVQEDLRIWLPEKRFDVVVCNPPYIKKGSGHTNVLSEKAIAKHEVTSSIHDIMGKTEEILTERGRAFFVFPVKRMTEFEREAKKIGLVITRMRKVKPRKETPPNLFLAALEKKSRFPRSLDAGSVYEEDPFLILYDEDGRWSVEAQEIFAGREETDS